MTDIRMNPAAGGYQFFLSIKADLRLGRMLWTEANPDEGPRGVIVTVFKPDVEVGYEGVMTVGSTNPIRDLWHRRRGDSWKPLWMHYLREMDLEERWVPQQKADIPYFIGSVLVLKLKARQALASVLESDAELLPVYGDDGEELWLVHPWRVVDALDEAGSDIQRFPDGAVMKVDRYAFREDAIDGLGCFRIPQLPEMFVTDEVVETVRRAGLRGTIFRPVWHS